MQVARISMGEYKTIEALDQLLKIIPKIFGNFF